MRENRSGSVIRDYGKRGVSVGARCTSAPPLLGKYSSSNGPVNHIILFLEGEAEGVCGARDPRKTSKRKHPGFAPLSLSLSFSRSLAGSLTRSLALSLPIYLSIYLSISLSCSHPRVVRESRENGAASLRKRVAAEIAE